MCPLMMVLPGQRKRLGSNVSVHYAVHALVLHLAALVSQGKPKKEHNSGRKIHKVRHRFFLSWVKRADYSTETGRWSAATGCVGPRCARAALRRASSPA